MATARRSRTSPWSSANAGSPPSIGPSGCGKSTLLRCFNRMNDLIENVRIDGQVRTADRDIYSPDVDVIELRKRVGMVFQKSNPFPKSIYENIAYALRFAKSLERIADHATNIAEEVVFLCEGRDIRHA